MISKMSLGGRPRQHEGLLPARRGAMADRDAILPILIVARAALSRLILLREESLGQRLLPAGRGGATK